MARLIHQISGKKSRSLNVIFAYAAPTFCLSTMLDGGDKHSAAK